MKMIIDIPDNELKVPLRNIHLLISDGIVTEVCIKKYDKDEPYFMDLNYAPLEECADVLDEIRSEILHLHDWAFDREEILRIIDKYKSESEE